MTEQQHILISLEGRHAENIFDGQKHVELRRRTMNVGVGTTVWIYVKLPVGSVVGFAHVSGVHTMAPSTLWRRFSSVSGLTRAEFDEYFNGIEKGVAIELKSPSRLARAVTLKRLRKLSAGFQPPQFFMRLPAESAILKTLFSSKVFSSDGLPSVRAQIR